MRSRHPGDELVRERAQLAGGQAEPLEPEAREGDVERPVGAPVRRVRHRQLAERAARCGGVLDLQQEERGRLQVAVAAGEQPLDVAELELHSACTHSSASPSRSPARRRSFWAMLSAVRSP